MEQPRIWIDISNTPQVQFFASLVGAWREDPAFAGARPIVTLREKNETVALAKLRGLDGKVVGRDHENSLRKSGAMALRTLRLAATMPRFDVAVSFENPMPIPVAAVRRKPHVLLLDNDVKFENLNVGQSLETSLKERSRHVIVPEAMRGHLDRFSKAEITYYPGLKEHVHIHGFRPSPRPPEGVPFNDYVVIRPEALESLYVKEHRSLVPEIVAGLLADKIPVVLLGRADVADHPLLHRPKAALDGLHLLHHARAVLTGSGTMAREGTVLGIPAVSFFPGPRLLAVDRWLVEQGRMLHSRDPKAIVQHVRETAGRRRPPETDRSREVVRLISDHVRRVM